MLFFVAQILPMESGICSGTVSSEIPLSSPMDAFPKQKYGVFQSEDRISFTQYLSYSKKLLALQQRKIIYEVNICIVI